MPESNNVPEATRNAWRLIRAYRTVFGVEGTRTEAQAAVMADMERRSGLMLPAFRPDSMGGFDALRAAITDGRRAFHIETLAAIAAEMTEETKPKVQRP